MKLDSSLLDGVEIDSRWSDGPFLGIKLMPAKAKGKRFEELAHYVLEKLGHKVIRAINTDHDRIIDGLKTEIKGSTITKGSDDCFSFLQVRPAQDYDCLLLETLWFDGTVKFHRIPKQDLVAMISNGIFKKQHGGNRAESGTYCYNGNLKPFEPYLLTEVKING